MTTTVPLMADATLPAANGDWLYLLQGLGATRDRKITLEDLFSLNINMRVRNAAGNGWNAFATRAATGDMDLNAGSLCSTLRQLELATDSVGTVTPIVVDQHISGTLTNRLFLLDSDGNTKIPGSLILDNGEVTATLDIVADPDTTGTVLHSSSGVYAPRFTANEFADGTQGIIWAIWNGTDAGMDVTANDLQANGKATIQELEVNAAANLSTLNVTGEVATDFHMDGSYTNLSPSLLRLTYHTSEATVTDGFGLGFEFFTKIATGTMISAGKIRTIRHESDAKYDMEFDVEDGVGTRKALKLAHSNGNATSWLAPSCVDTALPLFIIAGEHDNVGGYIKLKNPSETGISYLMDGSTGQTSFEYFSWGHDKISFFGATPVVKQEAPIEAESIYGTTPDGVIQYADTTYDNTVINNNFRDLSHQIGRIMGFLYNYGLVKYPV